MSQIELKTWRFTKLDQSWQRGDSPVLWSHWIYPLAPVKDKAITSWAAPPGDDKTHRNVSVPWKPREGRPVSESGRENWAICGSGPTTDFLCCQFTHHTEALSLETLKRKCVCVNPVKALCLTRVGSLCCCPEAGERTRWVTSLLVGSPTALDGFLGSVLGWEQTLQNPAIHDSQDRGLFFLSCSPGPWTHRHHRKGGERSDWIHACWELYILVSRQYAIVVSLRQWTPFLKRTAGPFNRRPRLLLVWVDSIGKNFEKERGEITNFYFQVTEIIITEYPCLFSPCYLYIKG